MFKTIMKYKFKCNKKNVFKQIKNVKEQFKRNLHQV